MKILNMIEDAYDYLTSGFFGDVETRIITRKIIKQSVEAGTIS